MMGIMLFMYCAIADTFFCQLHEFKACTKFKYPCKLMSSGYNELISKRERYID